MRCDVCGTQVRGWVELREHVRTEHPERVGLYW